MIACPSCAAEQSESSHFCSRCGAALRPEIEATVAQNPAGTPPGSQTRSSLSDSSHHGRFLPGTKVADRYRIVSLVGRGGMGEVYRADDLKLGHPVALKFLPKDLARDARRLEYFHSEVRLTRQISHPNVCRVYDIGEVDGQHFLSMEYIDGEDLRILLRRIGRLSRDKGIQIAQQLCAGLAAAHEKGVLHRDLKPANIMIDGRGQVRVTDFGLATIEGSSSDGEIAGTPAYMAPEQLSKGQTTIQSDLYALGLMLFELFTGEAVHKTGSIPELLREHEKSSHSQPSDLVGDMDPVVERAILRCLQKEPRERPNSARAVAASLPGGDPLAAALAAGETPSPAMIAAAGESGGLQPLVGGLLLAGVCLVLAVLPFVADHRDTFGVSRLQDNEPAVLKKAATDLIQSLGFNEAPAVIAFGFEETAKKDLRFWYRQTDQAMHPRLPDFWGYPDSWTVTTSNPSPLEPGTINVLFDPAGRLHHLLAVPAAVGPSDSQGSSPDWDAVFALAGLDAGDYEPADDEPDSLQHLPPQRVDLTKRWRSKRSGEQPLEVIMAARDGRIVYFDRIADAAEPSYFFRTPATPRQAYGAVYSSIILVFTGLLALRNVRLRRADTEGALRCTLYYLAVDLALWFLAAPHLGSVDSSAVFGANYLIFATAKAMRLWVFYVAVEPFVRRFWPDLFVSWSRLLSGRFRDPLVGRELLIGCFIGGAWGLIFVSTTSLGFDGNSFGGATQVLARVLTVHQFGIHAGMSLMAFLLLMRLLFRNTWLAVAPFVLITAFLFRREDATLVDSMLAALFWLTLAAVYIRFGLVAAISTMISVVLLISVAQTTELDAWYSGPFKFVFATIIAVAAYGFYTSTIAGLLTNENAR